MRKICLIIALTLLGCSQVNPPIPNAVRSEGQLGNAQTKRDSVVSASLEAAEFAANKLDASPAKDATIGAIGVGRAWAGPATDEDRLYMMKLVNLALEKKVEAAQAGWNLLKSKADENAKEIESLKKAVQDERAKATQEWQAKLDKVQADADRERNRWIMGIFFGLGALGIAGGVVMLVLAGQYAAIYPFLGPKAAFGAIGAGLSLVATGIAVNAIERALDRHPWVIGAGVGCAILLIAISASLVYANHHHATKS